MPAGKHWRPHEDELLLQLVSERHGWFSWHGLAEKIPGRSESSCRLRFNALCSKFMGQESNGDGDAWASYGDYAKRALKERESGAGPQFRVWLPSEDKILEEIAAGGATLSRWNSLAWKIPGRTGVACDTRWRNLRKQKGAGKQHSDEESSTSTDSDAFDTESTPTRRAVDPPGPRRRLLTRSQARNISTSAAATGSSHQGTSSIHNDDGSVSEDIQSETFDEATTSGQISGPLGDSNNAGDMYGAGEPKDGDEERLDSLEAAELEASERELRNLRKALRKQTRRREIDEAKAAIAMLKRELNSA